MQALRNSLRFYSAQLIALEILLFVVRIAFTIISYPFKRTWSGFDIFMLWEWAFHWNKPIWSWAFLGYWICIIIASLILEAIANKLVGGD
jgi:hypothetical protein